MPSILNLIPTPSWDRLRIIGNSRLTKITMIMPLIGYMIVFNTKIVSALQLASAYLSPEVESTLLGYTENNSLYKRLILIYFGLFVTGVGSIFFTLFCPVKIKQYVDAVEFADRELPFLPVPHFHTFVDQLSGRRNPVYAGTDMEDYHDRLVTSDPDALQTLKIQIITEWYWSQSRRNPLIRWISCTCFVFGFMLLSYPSVSTVISVLRAAFNG